MIIENNTLSLEYLNETNSFILISKVNNKIYKTYPLYYLKTSNIKLLNSTSMRIVCTITDKSYGTLYNKSIIIYATLKDEYVDFTITATQIHKLTRAIPFPGHIVATDTNQEFIIPYAEGIVAEASVINDFGEFHMWGHKSTLPFVGLVGDDGTGIMMLSENPQDTSIGFEQKTGDFYSMVLKHWPSKGKFDYERKFKIIIIESDGYNEMANWYRTNVAILNTFTSKNINNPKIDKLIGCVDFWLSDYTKTKSFVDDIITSTKLKKIMFNFQYGWYIYPSEYRTKLINYLAEKGYLVGRYENVSDIYENGASDISPRFRDDCPERMILKQNGTPEAGWTAIYNGVKLQGGSINSSFWEVDAKTRIIEDLKIHNYDSRFIDVVCASRLYEDYSKNHLMTRKEDIINRKNLLNMLVNELKLIIGTEQSTDWSMDVSDYGEGTLSIKTANGSGSDWSTPVENPDVLCKKYLNPIYRIPLVSLIYHDCHISTWYTGDGVSKIPSLWANKDLLTILYGAMQLIFPPNVEYWEENKAKFLWSIRVTSEVFEKVGYAQMTRHEYISEDRLVQKTEFSNGYSIVVNFKDLSFNYNGVSIPSKGFAGYLNNNLLISIAMDINKFN